MPNAHARKWRQTVILALSLVSTDLLAVDWPQFGFDQSHSNNNLSESTITASNVHQLVRVARIPEPSDAGGSAVYLSAVSIAGRNTDVLFFSGGDGVISAFDVISGTLLWSQSTPVTLRQGQYPVYESSTPVLDPDRASIYHYGSDGKIHKYAVVSGVE